jgi:LuxR family quorum sensing-dependent transcriptional regulator
VLEELHAVTTRHLPLSVLGAMRLPLKSGDWASIQLGKLAFLHKSVPEGWWEEYNALARGKFRPMLYLAASSMAMHTWTEMRRMFQPIGVDNWTYDLALKHGMRDGLSCPVGGRWVVAFWSAQGAIQPCNATDADHDWRRGQLCGTALGAACRS